MLELRKAGIIQGRVFDPKEPVPVLNRKDQRENYRDYGHGSWGTTLDSGHIKRRTVKKIEMEDCI